MPMTPFSTDDIARVAACYGMPARGFAEIITLAKCTHIGTDQDQPDTQTALHLSRFGLLPVRRLTYFTTLTKLASHFGLSVKEDSARDLFGTLLGHYGVPPTYCSFTSKVPLTEGIVRRIIELLIQHEHIIGTIEPSPSSLGQLKYVSSIPVPERAPFCWWPYSIVSQERWFDEEAGKRRDYPIRPDYLSYSLSTNVKANMISVAECASAVKLPEAEAVEILRRAGHSEVEDDFSMLTPPRKRLATVHLTIALYRARYPQEYSQWLMPHTCVNPGCEYAADRSGKVGAEKGPVAHQATGPSPNASRRIVIDAANIGGDLSYLPPGEQWRALLLLRELVARRCPSALCTLVFDAGYAGFVLHSDVKSQFRALEAKGLLRQAASQREADEVLLHAARAFGAAIVSNDRFEKYWPTIEGPIFVQPFIIQTVGSEGASGNRKLTHPTIEN